MDFGAFGEWWNNGIGAWWNHQEWGNVAQWVSGLLTAGSLFLGFTILRRDRDKAARSSADAFVTWVKAKKTDSRDGVRYETTVYGYNAGDLPILDPQVRIRQGGDRPSMARSFGLALNAIGPSVEAQSRFDLDLPPISSRFIVTFKDAMGQEWARDVRTAKYIRPKRRMKLLTRLQASISAKRGSRKSKSKSKSK